MSYKLISKKLFVGKEKRNLTVEFGKYKEKSLIWVAKNDLDFFKQIENEIILNPFSENIVYFDRKDSLSITFYNNSLIVNTLFNKYFDKCAYLIETKAFGGEHRIYFYKKKYWEVELFQTKSESGISPYHNSPLFRNLYGDTITEKISYELYGFESCGKCYKLILPVIIDNIYRFDIELTFVR